MDIDANHSESIDSTIDFQHAEGETQHNEWTDSEDAGTSTHYPDSQVGLLEAREYVILVLL